MNYKTQYYKGIPLNLIYRKYKNMKAKRFVINHTNQKMCGFLTNISKKMEQ